MEWLGLLCLLTIPMFFVGVLVAAPLALYWASPARALRGLPVTPIASAPIGQRVRLIGEVQPLEPLTSALGGEAVAAFRFTLWARGRKDMRVVLQRTEAVPFTIRDESGAVARLEDPTQAVFSFRDRREGASHALDAPSDAELAALARYGFEPKNELGIHRSYRYHEERLPVGARAEIAAVVSAIAPDGARLLGPPEDGKIAVVA